MYLKFVLLHNENYPVIWLKTHKLDGIWSRNGI